MIQSVPLFLGIIYEEATYLELFLCFKMSMFTNLSTSVLRVSSFTFGKGNDLVCYGWAPTRSSILYPEA